MLTKLQVKQVDKIMGDQAAIRWFLQLYQNLGYWQAIETIKRGEYQGEITVEHAIEIINRLHLVIHETIMNWGMPTLITDRVKAN